MRWLLLTDGLSPFEMGGMQKHSANLLRQLLFSGHDVDVAHCITQQNHFVSSDEVCQRVGITPSQGLTIQQFRFPKMGIMPGHYIKESYTYSVDLYRYYAKKDVHWDIVFAQGFTGWKFIEERRKGNWSVPVVNHFHGLEMYQPVNGWKQKMQQWMFKSPVQWNLRFADATVSLGGRITDIMLKLGIKEEKIISLPVAIDEAWFNSKPRSSNDQPLTLLFVGRFESRKGLSSLLTAFEKVLSDQTDITLSIVGNIPHSQRRKITNVKYVGLVKEEEEMKRIMDAHDILMVPSMAEGMPTVILEAMSRRMSVMCTPVGANEVMVDEKSGWVLKSYALEDIMVGLNFIKSATRGEVIAQGENGYQKCKINWNWKEVMGDFTNHVQKRFQIGQKS
jgi:glycosyltransferase involved in cell wall biosynthesis